MTRPKNEKELYNLRHSSCRNIIERAFGIAKGRFKVSRPFRTTSTRHAIGVGRHLELLAEIVQIFAY